MMMSMVDFGQVSGWNEQQQHQQQQQQQQVEVEGSLTRCQLQLPSEQTLREKAGVSWKFCCRGEVLLCEGGKKQALLLLLLTLMPWLCEFQRILAGELH
jgi:hypothetical protein